MTRPKIITCYEWPPCPGGGFWRAWRDGNEEAGVYGQGATEAAAIADLEAQEDDGKGPAPRAKTSVIQSVIGYLQSKFRLLPPPYPHWASAPAGAQAPALLSPCVDPAQLPYCPPVDNCFERPGVNDSGAATLFRLMPLRAFEIVGDGLAYNGNQCEAWGRRPRPEIEPASYWLHHDHDDDVVKTDHAIVMPDGNAFEIVNAWPYRLIGPVQLGMLVVAYHAMKDGCPEATSSRVIISDPPRL